MWLKVTKTADLISVPAKQLLLILYSDTSHAACGWSIVYSTGGLSPSLKSSKAVWGEMLYHVSTSYIMGKGSRTTAVYFRKKVPWKFPKINNKPNHELKKKNFTETTTEAAWINSRALTFHTQQTTPFSVNVAAPTHPLHLCLRSVQGSAFYDFWFRHQRV